MSSSNQRIRVLVVEDNEVNQKVIRRMLERMGCDVDVANDGVEGVELAERGYGMIFMDISMPRMDGFAASEAIRRLDGSAAQTPIVALTAHATPADRLKCLSAGMDLWLPKPIVVEELVRAVSRFTGWKEGTSAVVDDVPLDEATVNGLLELCDPGDSSFMTDVVNDFREACDKAAEACRKQHAAGVHAELRIAARKAGDAAKAVGALRVMEIAERLETADDATLAERGAAWIDSLTREVLRAAVALMSRG